MQGLGVASAASRPAGADRAAARAALGPGTRWHPARGRFYRNASQVRAVGDEYRAHLAACTWEDEVAAADRLAGLYYQRSSDVYGMVDDTPPGASGRLRLRECVVRDERDGRGSWWAFQRVGPLVSTGGDMSHFVSWDDPAHLAEHLPTDGTALYLTGYAARAIDGFGPAAAAVPYPPVHLHHAHLNPDVNPYKWLTHFSLKSIARAGMAAFAWRPLSFVPNFLAVAHAIADQRIDQMHGDMQCPEEEGGTDCMIHRVADYGTPFTRTFYTDVMLQDVRARGSPPLTLFFESSLRISTSARVELSR